jgi:hypothetical protein
VVVFDDRTTLGLVRLRVKKAIDDVARLLRMAEARSVSRPPGRMNEITEEDIDALFKDL